MPRPSSTCNGLGIAEPQRCPACLNVKAKSSCWRNSGRWPQLNDAETTPNETPNARTLAETSSQLEDGSTSNTGPAGRQPHRPQIPRRRRQIQRAAEDRASSQCLCTFPRSTGTGFLCLQCQSARPFKARGPQSLQSARSAKLARRNALACSRARPCAPHQLTHLFDASLAGQGPDQRSS